VIGFGDELFQGCDLDTVGGHTATLRQRKQRSKRSLFSVNANFRHYPRSPSLANAHPPVVVFSGANSGARRLRETRTIANPFLFQRLVSPSAPVPGRDRCTRG
jgi:hypothetical protein